MDLLFAAHCLLLSLGCSHCMCSNQPLQSSRQCKPPKQSLEKMKRKKEAALEYSRTSLPSSSETERLAQGNFCHEKLVKNSAMMCWPARVQGFESFVLPSLHCRSAQSAHLGLGYPEEKSPTLLQKSQASTSTRTCGLFIPGSPNTLNASLSLTVMSFRSTSCNWGSKA